MSLWQKFQIALGAIPDLTLIDDEEQKRLNEIRKQILALKGEAIVTESLLDPVGLTPKSRKKEREQTLDSITPEDIQKELEAKQTLFDGLFDIEKTQQEKLSQLGKDALDEALNNEKILSAVEEEARRKTLIQTKILRAQEIEYAKQSLNAISDVLGETSAAGKSVAIASALINTYQGISAELATKTTTPFEFALKLANIASVTAIGFKSVKDIIATKLPSFVGDAGGGSGASGGASAPSFNVVGNSGVSQIAQTLNQDQDPIEAYVVAGNVTSAQEVNRNIIDNATIG